MTTTITFKADELERLLNNGKLFAAPVKDCLPALSVIRFDWADDRLFAVATNRYVLSWEQAQPVEADGREPFSISTGDVKRIIGIMSGDRAEEITVQYDPDAGTLQFTSNYGNSIKMSAVTSEYVKWRTLVDGYQPGEHKTITFSPAWLALLAKVDGGHRNAPVMFEFADGTKPVRVSIGEHFRALVVPIRNAG